MEQGVFVRNKTEKTVIVKGRVRGTDVAIRSDKDQGTCEEREKESTKGKFESDGARCENTLVGVKQT